MFEQHFKNIDNILHTDSGSATELDYVEQTSWVLFLKYLDDLEETKKTEAELAGKKYSFINEMLEKWQNQPLYKGKTPCMHDSLPVAAVLNSDIVKFEQKYVRVGLCGNERAKIITESEKAAGNTIIHAAVSADKDEFWFSFKKYL